MNPDTTDSESGGRRCSQAGHREAVNLVPPEKLVGDLRFTGEACHPSVGPGSGVGMARCQLSVPAASRVPGD